MHCPVVYLHGFIGHLAYPEFTAGLDDGRFLFPDLIGHGSMARAPGASIGLPEQVAHVRRLIVAAFGHEAVFLVGHSSGAAVAMLYADAFPDGVTGLISAEGNLSSSDAFLSARIAAMPPASVAAWLEVAKSAPEKWMALERIRVSPANVVRVHEALENQPSTTIHAMSRSIVAETSTPRYQQIVARVMETRPVHLVMGGRSQSISEVAPRFRNLAASVTVMPNTSHMMTLEDSAAFQAIVLKTIGVTARDQSAGDAA